MDSDLEGFRRNPTDGSFAKLAETKKSTEISERNVPLVLTSITVAVTISPVGYN